MDPSIWVAIISVLGTLIVTFGPKVLKSLNERARQLGEVHEQVKNTHTTNMREDIDLLLELMRSMQADITGLRHDGQQERQERVDLGARVTVIEQKYRSE